ncbi:MAG: glycosyltransferase family 2 protein [Microgenomates group bacterium]
MNISAVILTKNEEKNIKKCIESVSFCDEVIVIDDNSEDETIEIVKALGAKVYKRSLKGDFAGQRNFGLEKAKGKWVLFVDADERVSDNLRNEIIQIIDNPLINYLGFYLRRTDFMWGKELRYGETANVKLLRLARRKAGKWKRRVHEAWEVIGRTYELKSPLLHYPHPTLKEFFASVNAMSNLHAKANKEANKKSSLAKIIIWPTGHFVYNWILRLGFLDGIRGSVVALIMSFHSYLAWSKLWILQRRN